MKKDLIENSIKKHLEVLKLIDIDSISSAARILLNAIRNGNTIFWCGNGGSAADSQHIAAEFVGRFKGG